MTVLEVLLLAISMAIDAFAVCLAAGALPGLHGPRQAFRLAFHFGLFQFLMPIVGWLAGTGIEPFIRDVDHWVAFGLLAFVGGRMIYSAWQAKAAHGFGSISRLDTGGAIHCREHRCPGRRV